MIKYKNVNCSKCNNDVSAPVGQSLRTTRIESGVTLRAFARDIGYSAAYISDIENEKRACSPVILSKYEALPGN